MSKQLTVSIAFSVTMMSAFVLFAAIPETWSNLNDGHKNGAIAEAPAPSVFSEFSAK